MGDMPIPLKIKCFVWLVMRVRIIIRGRLQQLGVVQEEKNICPICGGGKEESKHLFVHCAWVYRL